MGHRIRRVALLLVTIAALAGCSSEPAPVPGNAPVSAPATGAVVPMAESKPVGLAVPAIGVDSSDLLDLGLDPAGRLEVPPDVQGVGWFDLSPTPGAPGPSIVAAHVDYGGVPGTFQKLDELKVGDEISVRRADGSTAVSETYKVTASPSRASRPTASTAIREPGDPAHHLRRLRLEHGLLRGQRGRVRSLVRAT